MMTTYDDHYREEHLFGEPYAEFVAFITQWPHRGEALDLGCGQGRDALFLASIGYNVTAIDISQVGVSQILAEAEERDLDVKGIVADIYALELTGGYDLILFDSMFHFEKPDRARELQLLRHAACHLNTSGLLCIFVHQSQRKEAIVKGFFTTSYPDWIVVADRYVDYVYEQKSANFRSAMKFNIFFVQRP
jgi:tellurite methyltransferase